MESGALVRSCLRTAGVALCVAVGALVGAAFPSAAQTVAVEVVESESGRPIPGAFVSLLDAEDQVRRNALTDGAGRFVFPYPGPGTYRIRAEMIGRETTVSAPFEFGGAGVSPLRLALDAHAISLAEIRVEADRRCRIRPDEASEVARVWEEARKALVVQTWTEREGLYRLDLATWIRDLDARGIRVVSEARSGATAVTRTPFAALPLEDLLRTGFVKPTEDGGHEYFGPDATILLSDAFLDGHCFRLTRSGDVPGAVGLAFEPDDADLPDIAGTLWLDEESAHLRSLDFRYTWAPWAEARGIAGGRVEFRAMPNGAWIIERWSIRAPLLGRQPDAVRSDDEGIRVVGIRETGGEVTGVSTLDRRVVSRTRTGTLSGLVWDSTRAAPLAGARVYLSGTSWAAETGADGRFVLDGLPDGVFTASFTHPRLDSLDVLAAGTEVSVTRGETTEVRMALPSMAAIQLAACRAEEREEGAAVLSGVVRDRTSGQPVPGAMVRVEWQEVTRTRPVVQATERWMEASTDGQGRYTACGVPVDEALRVRASFLDHEGVVAEAGFDVEEQRVLDLEMELPAGLLSVRTEAGAATAFVAGGQGVQGVLTDPESGTPVRSAEVSLRSPGGGILVTAVTDRDGFFRLETPTAGRYVFAGSALGYAEARNDSVDVTVGHLTVLDVRMVPEAFELEPLVVTAESRTYHLEMEGFYGRRDKGNGIFMPPELFEKRRPRRASDLFFGVAGASVAEPALGAGGRAVWFRSGFRGNTITAEGNAVPDVCWPMIFIDRHLVSPGGSAGNGADPAALDAIAADNIAAMEVYRSAAEIPSEFNGPNAACGVVVVWTHRGAGR